MKAFKYNTFQILEPSFLGNFHRILHELNIYNFMIFIVKTKKSVCQCVSPTFIKNAQLLRYFPLTINN
jgi:hypothetical protein